MSLASVNAGFDDVKVCFCSIICVYINFRLKTTKSASVLITSNIVAF